MRSGKDNSEFLKELMNLEQSLQKQNKSLLDMHIEVAKLSHCMHLIPTSSF